MIYEEPVLMKVGDVETVVLGIVTPGSDFDGTLVVGPIFPSGPLSDTDSGD